MSVRGVQYWGDRRTSGAPHVGVKLPLLLCPGGLRHSRGTLNGAIGPTSPDLRERLDEGECPSNRATLANPSSWLQRLRPVAQQTAVRLVLS